MSHTILSQWHHSAKTASSVWVYPDGCQDLICRQAVNGRPVWIVTAVDDTPRIVQSRPYEQFRGFRLRPGAVINRSELLEWVEKHPFTDITAAIDACTLIDNDVEEALTYLSNGRATINQVSGSIGVSIRTLQRKVKAVTGKTPLFWSNLARARKSAKAICTNEPLAHIAFENGYADQAHLTREIHKWFGQPPIKIRQNQSVITQIFDTGYGDSPLEMS